GGTQEQVLRAVINSMEFREHRIGQYYQIFLGRPAEPNEIRLLARPQSPTWDEHAVTPGILASDEDFARHGNSNGPWLTSLYRDVLGRRSDRSGLDWWGERLREGVSRLDVAAGFVSSKEARVRRGSVTEGAVLRPVVFLDEAMLAAHQAERALGAGPDGPGQ